MKSIPLARPNAHTGLQFAIAAEYVSRAELPLLHTGGTHLQRQILMSDVQCVCVCLCVCVCVCVSKILLKQSIMLLSPPLKPKEIQLREKRCYEPGKHPP